MNLCTRSLAVRIDWFSSGSLFWFRVCIEGPYPCFQIGAPRERGTTLAQRVVTHISVGVCFDQHRNADDVRYWELSGHALVPAMSACDPKRTLDLVPSLQIGPLS